MSSFHQMKQRLAKCRGNRGFFGSQMIINVRATASESINRRSISTFGSSGHSGAARHLAHRATLVRPELVPLLTAVSLALGLGVMTMYREMVHSPTVMVSKKARETVSEVDDPARAHKMAEKFVEDSPLRKVAAIKAHNSSRPD